MQAASTLGWSAAWGSINYYNSGLADYIECAGIIKDPLNQYMTASDSLKHRGLIIRVAIPSPLRRLFDYLPAVHSEQSLLPGTRVLVPFGKRELVGIVVECVTGSVIESGRLKAIKTILDEESLFSPALFKTLLWPILKIEGKKVMDICLLHLIQNYLQLVFLVLSMVNL